MTEEFHNDEKTRSLYLDIDQTYAYLGYVIQRAVICYLYYTSQLKFLVSEENACQ